MLKFETGKVADNILKFVNGGVNEGVSGTPSVTISFLNKKYFIISLSVTIGSSNG